MLLGPVCCYPLPLFLFSAICKRKTSLFQLQASVDQSSQQLLVPYLGMRVFPDCLCGVLRLRGIRTSASVLPLLHISRCYCSSISRAEHHCQEPQQELGPKVVLFFVCWLVGWFCFPLNLFNKTPDNEGMIHTRI